MLLHMGSIMLGSGKASASLIVLHCVFVFNQVLFWIGSVFGIIVTMKS